MSTRRIQFTPELVVAAMAEGNELHLRVTKGLPDGARLVGATVTRYPPGGGLLTLSFSIDDNDDTVTDEFLEVQSMVCTPPVP